MKDSGITKAVPADIPRLMAVELECGLSAWTALSYESELKRADSIILVRTIDDCVVGFVSGRGPAEAHRDAEINNIGVLSEFRGRGLGHALLAKFIDICSAQGAASIWLEARASNSSAIAFYRTHGFIDRGIRPNFYRDPLEDARLMSLSLEKGGPEKNDTKMLEN